MVCRNFIGTVFAFPKTAAAQTHIPVAQIVDDKFLNGTRHFGRLVIFIKFSYIANQRIEFGQYPTVNFRSVLVCHISFFVSKTIDIGIQAEKAVSIIERSEKLSTDFFQYFDIKFEIIPRIGIPNHIPTGWVGSVFFKRAKRVNGVAEAFTHFLPFGIEYQTIGNNVFVSHRIKNHGGNGMQSVEPTTGLINSFGDKICRKKFTVVYQFSVFKRIVPLGIRHRTAVKPYINQVGFSIHRFAAW